jgi:hypothetical protein
MENGARATMIPCAHFGNLAAVIQLPNHQAQKPQPEF